MIRKIGILGASLLCLVSLTSCEKDFNDIGTGVIKNTKFNTNEVELELEITPVDIQSVRADNIGTTITEYWMGVYKNQNYKTIESSFVSQIGLLNNLKTSDVKPASADGEIDSLFVLDKVILKIPYTATNKGKDSNGKPKFTLDSVLGNPNIATNLKIFKSGTYLNTLDPNNPSQPNSFMSNDTYLEEELLNDDAGFTFKPNAIDTMYTVTRHYSDGRTFESEEKLSNKAPFLAVPLNTTRMKELFWDKFNGTEFSSAQEFNNYFRGLIVKSEGNDGSMVPIKLTGSSDLPSIDFYYTITRFEKKADNSNLVYKDTVPTRYSFPLSGVRNSIYKMSPRINPIPSDNFILQGTAGSMAEVKVLGVNLTKLKQNDPTNSILKYESYDNNPKDGYLDLKELSNVRNVANEEYGFLVNDASLSFYINQTANTNKNIIPQRIFLYTGSDDGNGNVLPIQITDSYTESGTFGGNLELVDEKPEKYTLRITDYISNLFDRTSTNYSPLLLKVYNNPTDNPYRNRILETNVLSYNWNPRGVTLLNENETTNGAKKAVLKLTYSEKR